jgi:hypothetical protein
VFCDDKQAVLINDVQLRKHPEDVLYPVASRVRLQFLNLCEGISANVWRDFPYRRVLKIGGRETNRKSRFLDCGTRGVVQNSQLSNEMVEGGTKVVNTIAKDNCEPWVKRRFIRPSDNQFILVLDFVPSGFTLFGIHLPYSHVDVSEVIVCPE